MDAAFALQRRADDDAWPTVGGIPGKILRCLFTCFQESRPNDQIFRRIAGQEKLGIKHQIGALPRGVRPRLARLCQIAGDIADGRVQLGDSDAENVTDLAHHADVARPLMRCNGVSALTSWLTHASSSCSSGT
jgi:hypothetical protein